MCECWAARGCACLMQNLFCSGFKVFSTALWSHSCIINLVQKTQCHTHSFLNSIWIISYTKIPLHEESQGGLYCRIAYDIIIETLCCPCLKAMKLLYADLTVRGIVCEWKCEWMKLDLRFISVKSLFDA